MDEELKKLRESIDQIDDELLALLIQRAALAKQTKQFKQTDKSGSHIVYDPTREQSILERLSALPSGDFDPESVQHIFQTIMGECRHVQSSDLNQSIVVSLQGDEGSFSEEAARFFIRKRLRSKTTLKYDLVPEQVMVSLQSGDAHYGVMAVNNAWGGLVQDSISALAAQQHRIIDLIPLPVRQCLLMHPSSDIEGIKRVVSHPQALRQCRHYLDTHFPGIEQVPYADTALAARDCGAGRLQPGDAVIASEACADLFNLSVERRSIQDLGDNDTLFVVIACYAQDNSSLLPQDCRIDSS